MKLILYSIYVTFSLIFYSSCSKSSYKGEVKGSYEILNKEINTNLDQKAKIHGYVLMGSDSFPGSLIYVNDKYRLSTDSTGYFEINLESDSCYVFKIHNLGKLSLTTDSICFNKYESIEVKFNVGYTWIY